MAILPLMSSPDPTLEAIDRELVERSRRGPRRTYLGMSSLGHPCSRKLWYDFHAPVAGAAYDAVSIKRFDDGHQGEKTMAHRLRMVPGIQLHTVDPATGYQFEFVDHDGQFKGHMDGAILGLFQAPKTWHVWEHKVANEKKQGDLVKHVASLGEKSALAAWDEIYHAQAILYMHYSGMERHYLTCSSPGERSTISVRTAADPIAAIKLIDKAKRIIEAPAPLMRISNTASWWQCRTCSHQVVCHGA